MPRSALLRSTLLVSTMFFFAAPVVRAEDVAKVSASSEITVAHVGANYKVTTTNRRFETDTLGMALGKPDEILYQLLMIEETHVSTEGPKIDADQVSAKVKVTAYPLSDAGKGAARYTIEADGDAARADGPYLTVTQWGCCADQATHAVYSLETGAYLFNATGEGESGQWATMNAHGGWANERVFAAHVVPTMADDAVLKGVANAAAVISYSASTKPLQRVIVTVPKALLEDDDKGPTNWGPKIDLISKAEPKGTDHIFVDKTDAPANLFTGVTVRLTLDEKTVITIPLVGDKLNIAGAKLPKGFALQDVAP